MYHINSQFSIQIGREGLKTSWYDNGQKKSKRTYKEGKLIFSEKWKLDGSVKN